MSTIQRPRINPSDINIESTDWSFEGSHLVMKTPENTNIIIGKKDYTDVVSNAKKRIQELENIQESRKLSDEEYNELFVTKFKIGEQIQPRRNRGSNEPHLFSQYHEKNKLRKYKPEQEQYDIFKKVKPIDYIVPTGFIQKQHDSVGIQRDVINTIKPGESIYKKNRNPYRHPMSGKSVTIIKGPYKSYGGIVTHVRNSIAHVKLDTIPKTISIPRYNLIVKETLMPIQNIYEAEPVEAEYLDSTEERKAVEPITNNGETDEQEYTIQYEDSEDEDAEEIDYGIDDGDEEQDEKYY